MILSFIPVSYLFSFASYFATITGMKDKNGDLGEIMGIVGSLVAF
jgi:hypothetical protein